MRTIRTGDCEEGFEDFAGKDPVLVVGGMVRHQIDDEVMSDHRNKSSKWLQHGSQQLMGTETCLRVLLLGKNRGCFGQKNHGPFYCGRGGCRG